MGVFDSIDYGKLASGAMEAGLNGLSGGIAGTLLSGFTSLFGGNSSLKANKKMAAYQAQLEQANWEKRFNMMNEYNTPTAMRERLKAAGMNENLVYGALSPNMAASPSASAPSGSISKYQTAMEQSILAQQILQSNADLKVKASEEEKNYADADKARAQAKRERTNNEIDTQTLKEKLQYYNSGFWISNIIEANKQNIANTKLMNEQVRVQNATYQNLMKDLEVKDANISNIQSETALNYAKGEEIANMIQIQWRRLHLDERIGEQKIKELASIVALNGAMQGYYESEKKTNDYINKFLPGNLYNDAKIKQKNLEAVTEQVKQLKNETFRSDIKNFKGDKWYQHAAGVLLNLTDMIGFSLGFSGSKSSSSSRAVVNSSSNSTVTHYNGDNYY